MQLTILSKSGLPLADAPPRPDEAEAHIAGRSKAGQAHASFAEVLDEGETRPGVEAEELTPGSPTANEADVQTEDTAEAGESEQADLPDRSTPAMREPEQPAPHTEERLEPQPTDPAPHAAVGLAAPAPEGTSPFTPARGYRSGPPAHAQEMAADPVLPAQAQAQGVSVMPGGLAKQNLAAATESLTQQGMPAAAESNTEAVQSSRAVAPVSRITESHFAARFAAEHSEPSSGPGESLRMTPASSADTAGSAATPSTQKRAPDTSTLTVEVSSAHLHSAPTALRPQVHEDFTEPADPRGKQPASEVSSSHPAALPASRTAHGSMPHHPSATRPAVPHVAQISNPPQAERLAAASDLQPRASAPDQPSDGPLVRVQGQPPAPVISPVQSSFAAAPLPGGLASARAAELPVESTGDELAPLTGLCFSSLPGSALHRSNPGTAFIHSGTPRHVAAQIAEAIQHAGSSRAIDLTLNPAELGRVKISLHPTDGSMVVNVVADRGETLDLMRRHAEMLAEELRSIGYEEAQFSFSQHTSGEERTPDKAADRVDGDARKIASAGEVSPNSPVSIGLTLSDRVDIRV